MGRARGAALDVQVFPFWFEPNAVKAVIGAERDFDVVDRHDLFAERHVVVWQRVVGGRVEVAEEVNDQPLRSALRLTHQR